jgi:hypothetical protein
MLEAHSLITDPAQAATLTLELIFDDRQPAARNLGGLSSVGMY